MLSGPRHLLSALALGMRVGPCCGSAGPVFLCLLAAFCVLAVSFVCLFALGFGFVISLGLSRPVGSAGMGGHCWWTGVEEDVLCLFFFCYSWPLGHREASKRIMLEFA